MSGIDLYSGLGRRSGHLWGAAVLLAGLALSAQARELAHRDWFVNAWGEAPPNVAHGIGADERCRRGSDGGMHFQVLDKRKGTAELTLPPVLKPGVAYEFTAQMRLFATAAGNAATVPVDVFFRKDGPHYQAAVVRTVALGAAWQQVSVKGVYFPDGPGAVRLSVPAGAGRLCVAEARLAEISPDAVGTPDRAFKVTPLLFGVHLNQLGTHNGWPEFGPGVVRLWDSGTTWSEMQPQNEAIDWVRNPSASRLGYYVKHVRRYGEGDTQILMTLGMTPTWAAAAGDCGQAPYGRSSCLPPASRAEWRRYVAAVARKFHGKIGLWEVWNEADIYYHWGGSLTQLVDVLKDAREELKADDPRNVVIGPNITVNNLRMLNDMLNMGAGQYMDGLSFHSYFGNKPDVALAAVRNIRQMMSYQGLDLPLWNSEVAVGCGMGPECPKVGSEASRRSGLESIAQGLIGEAAYGVINVNYHTWEGGGVQGGNLPLVESDFSTETEAGRLYGRLKTLLVGQSLRWLEELPEGGGLVEMSSPKGRVCVLAWAGRRGASLSSARLLGAKSLVPVDGSEAVALEGKSSVALKAMPAMACRP